MNDKVAAAVELLKELVEVQTTNSRGISNAWLRKKEKVWFQHCAETILAELGRLQRPTALGELSDEQWGELFIAMDMSIPTNEYCLPHVAKAAREFLGKVDG